MKKQNDGVDNIVAILTDALNDAMLQTDYIFYVGKNIENYVNNKPFVEAPREGTETPVSGRPAVNCYFQRYPSDIAPIKGVMDITVGGILYVMAKQIYADTINSILQRFAEINHASVGTVGNYAYVMELATVGDGRAAQREKVGVSTEFVIRCTFRFILGAVVSNNVHVFLDGVELPYFAFSAPRARIAQTDQILGSTEMQSYIAQQGIDFSLNLPYVAEGPVAEVVQDLYTGPLGKVYKFAYYDDITATKTNPYGYDVVLVSAENACVPGKLATLQVMFSLARQDVYESEIGGKDDGSI